MNSQKTQRFKFINKRNEFEYCPKKELMSFYQICQFKNPYSGRYDTRKIIFNEHGEIVKTFEKEYSQEKITKFTKSHRENKYCMYPVTSIKLIDLPDPANILEAKSELLNNNNTDYGWAKY